MPTDHDHQALSEALRFPAVRSEMRWARQYRRTNAKDDPVEYDDGVEWTACWQTNTGRRVFRDCANATHHDIMLAESACGRELDDYTIYRPVGNGDWLVEAETVLGWIRRDGPTRLAALVAALGAAGVERD